MASYLTTNNLIASAKNRAMIPENQSTFKTADFLRFINEELMNAVLPTVMRAHEDYYLREVDVPLVANRSSYSIPHRAVGNKLRDVSYIDENNNVTEMTRISVGEISHFQGAANATGQYRTFYVRGNEVVLTPGVGDSVTGSLRFTMYFRPNQLVEETRAGTITSINTTTGEIGLNQIPSNFTTSIKYDFIEKDSPHKILNYDKTASAVNTTTISVTFPAADIPYGLEIGDNLMQAEEAIIPQLPSELHSILAHRVAIRCLEAMGDGQNLQLAMAKLQEMEVNMYTLIDDRVEEAPKKAVNRRGALREAIFSKNFRRRG